MSLRQEIRMNEEREQSRRLQESQDAMLERLDRLAEDIKNLVRDFLRGLRPNGQPN